MEKAREREREREIKGDKLKEEQNLDPIGSERNKGRARLLSRARAATAAFPKKNIIRATTKEATTFSCSFVMTQC